MKYASVLREREVMDSKKGRELVKWALFILYIAVMIYFMFFAEMFGRTPSAQYRYNLVPFKEIMRFIRYSSTLGMQAVMLNIVGNIAAFIPFGVGLTSLTKRRLGFFSVTLYSASLSITVELIQLLTRVGTCDVDDIILNTAGGMIGYGVYILIKKVCSLVKGRGTQKNETV